MRSAITSAIRWVTAGLCGCLIILFLGSWASAQGENATRLSLQEAYQKAMSRNQDIASSREDVVQARKEVTAATSHLYPQLTGTGQYTLQKELAEENRFSPGTPGDYGTATLELDQHLYQWGKVWSGREAAKEYLEGTLAEQDRTVQQILFRVASSYYEVLLGRRSIQIAQSALERAKAQLERAQGRREVGVATMSDVLRAEVQVAQSEEQLERARNQYDVARESLALEMGVDTISRKLTHPPKRQVAANATMHSLYSKALAHRKDLKALDNRVQAARANTDWEEADYFPRLSAHGSYTRTNEPVIFQDNHEDWRASLRLTYPLYTGGREKAEVEKARSELMQVRTRRSRLEREIRQQVRSVYLDLQTQRSVIQQLEKQVESAERNYKQVTARFEEGAASSVDQVDAFTALNEAKNRLAKARYTYQLDMVRLDLVTGVFQQERIAGKETP